ncbi:MAG: AAA family ATPase [Spiribacter salinus]|uniref:AAA family ATPase n=1 Tax=Spiribacter salinus TaxID=1335746 RepID=A0A540VR61_9GAMM|nr:MAG: AAA family ATPase [Spiribacter salinus]
MPLITRIARLRHPGVLRDFTWSGELPDFAQYNLIYGWNGSGKTTISELFRALERRQAPEGEAELIIDGKKVAGTDFHDVTVPVRVFNRAFVSKSVFPVGGGDVPPIFVLGKESAENQAKVETLKQQKIAVKENLDTAKAEKSGAENSLNKHCTDSATIVREALRSSGNNPYNNYDKRRYRQCADQMLAAQDKSQRLLAEEDRDRLTAQSHAVPKDKIDKVHYQLPDLNRYQEVASELLQATVVSSAISTLKDDTGLASWVRQGLGLHQQRDTERCLFCEQPLPAGRIASLEAHFNAEYEQLIRQLDEQIAQLDRAAHAVDQVSLPDSAKFYEDLAAEYETARSALADTNQAVAGFLEALMEELEQKKRQVFEARESAVSVPIVQSKVVQNVNAVIQKHNDACDAFDDRVTTAQQQLEADSVARSLEDYAALKEHISAGEEAIAKAKGEVNRLDQEIMELEREIIQHRQPAEELNDDLHAYLGHRELRLDVKDTGYTISRIDGPARALSEGERTAIALLYFLKSLQGRHFEMPNGIVVLDDPVSSLDANALYLAFGFIRRRVDGVAQVFILTHNFSFFRQVRNWFHHLKGQGKNDIAKRPARFYMLEATLTDEGRRSSIRPLDPLLERFESEYHYLFACIYRRTQAADGYSLEANYVFPNMARRLLETFLAFRQPDIAGELRQKLERVDFDETKKTRILRFLHTHSHADEIGEPEHDPSGLGEAQGVLKDLLELLEQEDREHYGAMVALVGPPAEEKQPE